MIISIIWKLLSCNLIQMWLNGTAVASFATFTEDPQGPTSRSLVYFHNQVNLLSCCMCVCVCMFMCIYMEGRNVWYIVSQQACHYNLAILNGIIYTYIVESRYLKCPPCTNGCSWVEVFETENVSTRSRLRPLNFRFMPNALTFWDIRHFKLGFEHTILR